MRFLNTHIINFLAYFDPFILYYYVNLILYNFYFLKRSGLLIFKKFDFFESTYLSPERSKQIFVCLTHVGTYFRSQLFCVIFKCIIERSTLEIE